MTDLADLARIARPGELVIITVPADTPDAATVRRMLLQDTARVAATTDVKFVVLPAGVGAKVARPPRSVVGYGASALVAATRRTLRALRRR
jgi:hypothetical protein